MEGYYSVKQTAEAMHLSQKSVRNYIKAGKIPGVIWEERGQGMSQWWIPIEATEVAATATVDADVVQVTRQLSSAELGQIIQTAVQNAVQDVVKTEIQQLRVELDSHFKRQDERIREAIKPPHEERKSFWRRVFHR